MVVKFSNVSSSTNEETHALNRPATAQSNRSREAPRVEMHAAMNTELSRKALLLGRVGVDAIAFFDEPATDAAAMLDQLVKAQALLTE